AAYNEAKAFFEGGSFPSGTYTCHNAEDPYSCDAQDLLASYNTGFEGVPHCDPVDEDGPDYDGDLLPIEDFQLHAGEHIDCFVELHFTNDDLVEEGRDYSFQYHIRGYQWNEDDYVDESLNQYPFNYGDLFP